MRIEIGRQDDIISLLYMMVEIHIGRLPWSDASSEVMHI